MREIDESLLINVSGADGNQADSNQQLLNTLGKNMAWGAGLGAMGGPGGAITGAVGGAVQTVIDGAIEHGPVNVPIPTVPMGPTWNGSGSGGGAGGSPCLLDKELMVSRPGMC